MKIPASAALVLIVLAACNGGPSGGPVIPPSSLACSDPNVVDLAVGEGVVLDPASSGNCIQFPAPATGTSQWIVATVATNGQESSNGTASTFTLAGADAAANPAAGPIEQDAPLAPVIGGFGHHPTANEFHRFIREWDRQISRDLGTRILPLAPRVGPRLVPVLGQVDSFNVCATTNCNSFVRVGATTMYVGTKSAIYLDNNSPPGGFTQADINKVGELFENQAYGLHRTDTTAFGSESDLDGNGVVKVLLTPRVNRLNSDCSTSVIVGFFLGNDLTDNTGSNHGEVFYHLVPDPTSATCAVPKDIATELLPVTFIHEFQHMISFNQHVLIHGGEEEETWLNEGLSHFAEELGGRVIADSECVNSCFSQFTQDNFNDAFSYLVNPGATFLIEPLNSGGTLQERGANWLFVRWFLDQFAADTVLGTDMTRALEATADSGFQNVANRSGVDFGTLVAQWQLANFLEGDTLFVQNDATSRFRYKTWNLRRIFTINSFPKPYPLTPTVVTTSVTHSGTLRAGSGIHYLIQRAASDTAFNLKLTIGNAAVAPRFGVVRIQ